MTALALVPWGAHAAARPNAQELVVTLAPGSSAAEGRRAAAAMGGRVIGSIPRLDAFLVRLGSPLPPRVLDSAVRSVEPNTAYRVDALPSDSLRPLQWSLTTIGIDELWEATLGDPSVTIAIVDTGVDYTHPEFAGRIVLGPDLADGDEDPIDTEGHGTAVAALAAAADDGQGIVGACPRCSVVAVKVAPDGSGAITKFASAAGIVWAADHGADVINLSFGGIDPDDVQRDAVAYAHARGAIVVASAGNRGKGGVQYPAAYEQVVAVGASDRNDRPTPLHQLRTVGRSRGPRRDAPRALARRRSGSPNRDVLRCTSRGRDRRPRRLAQAERYPGRDDDGRSRRNGALAPGPLRTRPAHGPRPVARSDAPREARCPRHADADDRPGRRAARRLGTPAHGSCEGAPRRHGQPADDGEPALQRPSWQAAARYGGGRAREWLSPLHLEAPGRVGRPHAERLARHRVRGVHRAARFHRPGAPTLSRSVQPPPSSSPYARR